MNNDDTDPMLDPARREGHVAEVIKMMEAEIEATRQARRQPSPQQGLIEPAAAIIGAVGVGNGIRAVT